MNFNIHPAGVSRGAAGADEAVNPPRPSSKIPKVEESEEEKDDKKKESPSILNPDKEAIEAWRKNQVEQKVQSVLETAETFGILGSTIDLRI